MTPNATPASVGRPTPRLALAVAALLSLAGLLAGCGVVDAAGSVAGSAVDLTVDAVDTTTDIVTAPL